MELVVFHFLRTSVVLLGVLGSHACFGDLTLGFFFLPLEGSLFGSEVLVGVFLLFLKYAAGGLEHRLVFNEDWLGVDGLAASLDELLHFLTHHGHLQHVRHRRPLAGILVEDHGYEVGQFFAVAVGNRVDVVLHNFIHQTEQVVGGEGMLERAELVQHAAQSPHVGLEGVGAVLANFGAVRGQSLAGLPHVVRSADHSLGSSIGVLQDPRNTEVSQLDGIVAGEENVGALDVAVEHLAAVDVLEGEADLDEPVEDLVLGEPLVLV